MTVTCRAAFLIAIAALTALLPACAPLVRPTAPEEKRPSQREAPAEFPRAYYEQAAAQGKPVYRIDPERSLVVIEVRRAGSLARLGHDHVVAARNVAGYVAPEAGRADLYVALDDLVVDEPTLRKEAGFDTQPSESDIAGTRANMLEKVLESGKFPHALIRVDRAGARDRLAISITLHGVTRTLEVPVQIDMEDRQASVTGRLEFNQTEFGITPFSILGGAIQVQDRLNLQFTIRAQRAP